MSKGKPTNIPASIRQRLLDKARKNQRLYNELVQYYAIERFLFRLSQSKYVSSFVLKGALLFTAWKMLDYRSTMDIDLLGKISNDMAYIEKIIREICSIDVAEDGVVFDPDSIATEGIAEGAEYQGVRVILSGKLDTIRIRIQIDIGFSDVIAPKPLKLDYPCILDMPCPQLNCYSRESLIAEKYQAMVQLETINSRMKDFYDIWFLSHTQDFDGLALSETIDATFKNRKTNIQPRPVAFSETFKCDDLKQRQWKAFLMKNRIGDVPEDFAEAVAMISEFLSPLTEALFENRKFKRTWIHEKGWK